MQYAVSGAVPGVWTGCVGFQDCPGHTSAMTCPYDSTALVRTPPLASCAQMSSLRMRWLAGHTHH